MATAIKFFKKCLHNNANMLPSHFIRFEHCGEFIAFYLPDADHDFVQRCMYRNKTFWEIRQLKIAKKCFPQNGFFVDVGAYVGNHSVYAAKFFGAKKIYAFEPQEAIIPILKKNISINRIDDKIEFFPVALTEHVQKMSISRILPGTSAGTAYGCDACGKTVGIPLDAYEIPCVDMLKIDVEGEEISVLRGAVKTIQRAHPIIWLEICSQNSLAVIQSFLQNYGYEYYKLISEMDYLFFYSTVPIQC